MVFCTTLQRGSHILLEICLPVKEQSNGGANSSSGPARGGGWWGGLAWRLGQTSGEQKGKAGKVEVGTDEMGGI